jgi:glycosyltransferase involved in cell wall biosynthesis
MMRRLLDALAMRGLELRPLVRGIRRRIRPAVSAPGLVSVIMPVRDRATLAARAAASVLAQRYQDWELIIVDDGSRDDLKRNLRPVIGHRRVRYVRQAARGAAAARNAGLRLASGSLIAYLDSDNEWLPGFLAGMVPVFADGEVQSAYGIVVYDNGVRRLPEFDRVSLLRANAIDLNVFVHRRGLGGVFDEGLRRLIDWDFILRCTADAPAIPVAVEGARYHEDAPGRISTSEDFVAPLQIIRGKWRDPLPATARAPRVLYALWQYPQQSEMYIETEIAALRERGVAIEVWSEEEASAAYVTDVPIHRGSLAEAIAAMRPDVIHTHWLNIGNKLSGQVAAAGLPFTVRAHGFDTNRGELAAALADATVRRIYAYPQQEAVAGVASPKLRRIDNAFNTAMFRPAAKRDRNMVVRASAGLPGRDLEMFLSVAKRFPRHRFVLAVTSCTMMEHYVGTLLAVRREIGSPAQIKVNISHEEVARLMGEAGIYLHTMVPPETPPGTPLGQPVSIAEAMASGCLVLHRRREEFERYAGNAGAAYDNEDEAAALIEATMAWDDAAWRRAEAKAIEWAWTFLAGDQTHDALYRDWVELAGL